jgi:hypothetical protein
MGHSPKTMIAKAKLSRGCPLAGHARHEKLIKATQQNLLKITTAFPHHRQQQHTNSNGRN